MNFGAGDLFQGEAAAGRAPEIPPIPVDLACHPDLQEPLLQRPVRRGVREHGAQGPQHLDWRLQEIVRRCVPEREAQQGPGECHALVGRRISLQRGSLLARRLPQDFLEPAPQLRPDTLRPLRERLPQLLLIHRSGRPLVLIRRVHQEAIIQLIYHRMIPLGAQIQRLVGSADEPAHGPLQPRIGLRVAGADRVPVENERAFWLRGGVGAGRRIIREAHHLGDPALRRHPDIAPAVVRDMERRGRVGRRGDVEMPVVRKRGACLRIRSGWIDDHRVAGDPGSRELVRAGHVAGQIAPPLKSPRPLR